MSNGRLFRGNSILESAAHRKWREIACNLDLTQFSLLTKAQYEAMNRFLNLSKGEQVLEIGCGVGRVAYDVQKRTGARVAAIDKNPETLAPGLEEFADFLDLQVLDFNQADYSPESFDAIYCIDSLKYVGNPETNVPRLIQILKKGGRLAVFWGQKIEPDQDPLLLQPDQSVFYKLLPKDEVRVSTICFTREGINFWKNTLIALDELEQAFIAEGEERMVMSLRHDANYQFSYINDNRYRRYLYCVEKT